MSRTSNRILGGLLAALSPMAGLAQPLAAPPPGARYVALGSSFAAGPGVTVSADTPPTHCGRSRDNYPHQLARKRGLVLTDVSCSGATTWHLLGPWAELPAQLDALDARTALVTITIGGNDVDYSSGMVVMACHTASKAAPQSEACPDLPPSSTERDWRDLETNLRKIAAEAHRRAPAARVVWVDYIRVLPPRGTCPALSLSLEQADMARAIDRQAGEITHRVAQETGGEMLAASTLTADHHACAPEPWVNGYPPRRGVPFHPRLEAHAAVAQALDRMIWK